MHFRNDGRFPGGPTTPQIINDRKSHRCDMIWKGDVDKPHKKKQTRYHGKILSEMLMEKGGGRHEKLESLGFGPISSLKWLYTDVNLCFAVAERYWPKTSTFHFPFGEMAITLEDVFYITGLPIVGKPLVAIPCSDNEELIRRCLGKLPDNSKELEQALKGRIKLQWLKKEFGKLPENANELEVQHYTRAYLLALCGCCLFPDKTGTYVDIQYLTLLESLDDVDKYAWGAATLSFLYACLESFSLSSVYDMSGCAMLLQAWIHEHFPSIGKPIVKDGDYRICALKYVTESRMYTQEPHHTLVYYRQEFDLLKAKDVVWAPYPRWPQSQPALEKAVYHRSCLICLEIIKYHPLDRCMRQCRFLQDIPGEPLTWDNIDSIPVKDWLDIVNEESQFHIVGQRLHGDNIADGFTPEYIRWYGRPVINNYGVVKEDPQFALRGYKEDLADALLAKCNNAANTLDNLCINCPSHEELCLALRGVATTLRSIDDLPIPPKEHLVAPRRVVKFPNITPIVDHDEGYVPLSPEHEKSIGNSDESMDEPDGSMDEPDESMDEPMSNVVYDDFLASDILYTKHGASSSTQVPPTPPEITPLYAPIEFTQDPSPYQIRRGRRDVYRAPREVQMCFGCTKSGHDRCIIHK